MIAHPHSRRRGHLFPVYESAEARIHVVDCATALVEMKLGVLARNHRPLLLRKEVMTDSRVATDEHHVAGKRVLAMKLTAAILCEN